MVIVSAVTCYNVSHLNPLVTSLNDVGYTGHKVMLYSSLDKQTLEFLNENGWRTVSIELEMVIHIQRYRDVAVTLEEYGEDEQVVFIDGRDVVFFKNPETWNLVDNLYVGIDGNGTHKEHKWAMHHFPLSFPDHLNLVLDKPHLCCGVIIGKNIEIRQLLTDIFYTALSSKQRIEIDPFILTPDDQMALNLLAYSKYKDLITISKPEDEYVINLAMTKWDGSPYFIFHQYDRIEEFFIKIKSC